MFYLIIFSAELRRQADLLVARSVSAGTRKNYDAVVEKLNSFCHSNKLKDKFAPSTIELFVTHLSQQQHLSYSTIQANLSALRHNCHVKHMPVDFDTPRLKLLLRGIKKSSSSSGVPARCTSRVSKAHLKRLCVAADVLFDTTYARMIKAIFTVAFFGLLRRSEEHTSELQSPVPISYAVFCLKKKTKNQKLFQQSHPTAEFYSKFCCTTIHA